MQRQGHGLFTGGAQGHRLERAILVPAAAYVALLDQIGHVLVDGRHAGQAERAANLLEGRVVSRDGEILLIRPAAWDGELRMHHARPLAEGTPVTVAIRPEKVRIGPVTGRGGSNRVAGRIEDIAYLGDVSIYHVELPGGVRLQATRANTVPRVQQPLTWDDEVELCWQPTGGVVLLS